MGGLPSNDPLALEERCLDLQFKNRKLKKDTEFLKAQRKKADAKQDAKAMSKEILRMEAEDMKKKS
jgi:hypothetical protein